MRKSIYKIFLFGLLLIGLGACNDDLFDGGELSMDGDVPVSFSFEDPSDFSDTRGVESYKQRFEEGDVIHIQGTFTSKDGKTGLAYGAMKLEGRKWVPVDSPIYWPYEAVKGDFKAFYIPGTTGPLRKNFYTNPVNLSTMKDDEDPLEAYREDVTYGYAVNLRFTHACTYLTIEKMEPNVTDYFWMVGPANNPIRNAYQLGLSSSGVLSLDFVSVKDASQGDLAYISRRSEAQVIDGQGYSSASFYLAPGNYSYFDLRTNNNYPFMSFQNSLTMPLEANHPYILNVLNAKGANYTTTTEKNWDENSGAVKIDVKEFLKAASEGHEYILEDEYGNQTPILKMVNGVLMLQCNVDFDGWDEYDQLPFNPDIANSTTFDGDLHYIVNIAHPVFRFNLGTIRNLGLKDFDSTVTAYEGDDYVSYSNDFSRIGGLCLWNRTGARIQNIRMENFNLTVNIQAEDPTQTSSNQTFNIGGLCGENASTISDIALKGEFNINVKAKDTAGDYSYVDADLRIGGIVGNHGMSLTGVGPQTGETFSITINNTCRGRSEWGAGVFCIGGAVGLSTGNDISQVVLPMVTVNATNSDGYQQYTGGLAGRLRGNDGLISNCTVQGTLTCGTVSEFGESGVNPYSYIGGIAGNVRGYTISNCRAVCNIKANVNTSPSAIYGTGGAFGRIQSGTTLISNSAYGTELTGPISDSSPIAYLGTFAGISRSEIDWSFLSANGNSARAINGYPQLGGVIDGGDTE